MALYGVTVFISPSWEHERFYKIPRQSVQQFSGFFSQNHKTLIYPVSRGRQTFPFEVKPQEDVFSSPFKGAYHAHNKALTCIGGFY